MGVYCHMCGEKMNFLRVPMTCKCDAVGEGICTGCEDKLFLPIYKQVEEVLYKKDEDGKYVEFQQTVYIMTESSSKCPDCGKAYDPEEFLDYDDRDAIRYRNQSDSDDDSDDDDSD